MDKFDVIIDTREQKPLRLTDECIANIYREKLDTGDYCIKGYEDILFIERKATFMEFYKNVSEKRFWNELERSKDFQYKFLIGQFDLEQVTTFPYGCGRPSNTWKNMKLTPNFLISAVSRIMIDYGIHFIFAGTEFSAIKIIERIMKDVYKNQK